MSDRPIALWVDTDMGHGTPASDVDDAFALAFLLAAERTRKVEVAYVSASFGNVPLDEAVPNTAALLDACDAADTPFYVGAAGPFLQDIRPWRERQAASLTGDEKHYRLPLSRPVGPQGNLWDLAAELEARREPIEVLTLGPLTSLALVLRCLPDAKAKIRRIVMMGGSAFAGGNITAAAELNVWLDPEAAQIVFSSGIPIVMIGLDVTRQRRVYAYDFDGWADGEAPPGRPSTLAYLRDGIGRWIAVRERMWGESWMYLHDAIAAAFFLRPELFQTVEAHVAVELAGTLTRGMTVVDARRGSEAPRNARVCIGLEADAVFQLIVGELEGAFGHSARKAGGR